MVDWALKINYLSIVFYTCILSCFIHVYMFVRCMPKIRTLFCLVDIKKALIFYLMCVLIHENQVGVMVIAPQLLLPVARTSCSSDLRPLL